MKSPSSNWTSCSPVGDFTSLILSPLRGSLGVDGGPSWVGDKLTRLSGGDRQGSSVFLEVVPLLNGSLGEGSRPISEAGLVGGLSKFSTHLTLACLGSSASEEAFLFCCHWGTSFAWLTSCGCSGSCVGCSTPFWLQLGYLGTSHTCSEVNSTLSLVPVNIIVIFISADGCFSLLYFFADLRLSFHALHMMHKKGTFSGVKCSWTT